MPLPHFLFVFILQIGKDENQSYEASCPKLSIITGITNIQLFKLNAFQTND